MGRGGYLSENDHGATARAIARQLKLINADNVLTGRELELMCMHELILNISCF
ncbi:MAG: magnesium-transporting ATPase (P-type) [Lentisphaeria bacterium]|jgi:magnesium-transporting ATPase (P-type)